MLLLWECSLNGHVSCKSEWREYQSLSLFDHNCPPLVVNLSQMNPVHVLPSYLFHTHILISSFYLFLDLSSGIFPLGFPTKFLYALPSVQCVTRFLPFSPSLVWGPKEFGPHNSLSFSLFIFLEPFVMSCILYQISSSATSTWIQQQIISLTSETRFHSHTKEEAKL